MVTGVRRAGRRGAATRNRIAAAAARLFSEQGYAATSMQAIADAAGVHVQTIYLAFGTKAAVLAQAAALLVAGVDDPDSHPSERQWVKAIQAEVEPAAKLKRYVSHIRDVATRMIPLTDMMRAAAPSEPDVASFLRQAEAGRRQGPHELLAPLVRAHALRDGLTLAEAADLTYAIASPDMFRALVHDRGWSWARAERWILGALERELLAA
jgi:AcrR family transcriptional regulator